MSIFSVRLIFTLVLLGLSTGLKITENVVFEKVNEVSTVRSKWIFSFVSDLRTYQGQTRKLQIRLNNVAQIIDETLDRFQEEGYEYYVPLLNAQQKEVKALNDMLAVAEYELQNVVMLQSESRVKRALVPIVGKALSFLFGTVSKSDLRKISRNINVLADNQETIIHVLNDSLSILNVTRVQVQENRHAIRQITEMIQTLDERLNYFVDSLKTYLTHLTDFILAYLQIDLMILELRENVEKTLFYMDDVKMQLDQLSLGHLSPSVLPSFQLKRILLDIQSKLPDNLKLPKNPQAVWYYYQVLNCVTLIKDHQFITIVNVPLLDRNSEFSIYEIHNIPLPYQQTGMVANYELETNHLAVNTKQTEFALLTTVDVARCAAPLTQFCTIHKALYEVDESDLCVISLFTGNYASVKENCQTTVTVNAALPQAQYVSDGDWLVVAEKPLSFTVMCLDLEPYQVQTQPPVFHVQLPINCEAYADDIVLPSYFTRQSYFEISHQKESLLTTQSFSNLQIWNPVNSLLNKSDSLNLDSLANLKEIETLPMDHLLAKLKTLKRPDRVKTIEIWEYVSYFAGPLVILCILVFLGVVWVRYRRNCCKSMPKEVMVKMSAKSDTTVPGAAVGDNDVVNVEPRAESSSDQRLGHATRMTSIELT